MVKSEQQYLETTLKIRHRDDNKDIYYTCNNKEI